jgi:hypothetical protein
MTRPRASLGLLGCVAVLLVTLFGWGLLMAALLSGRVI